MFNARIFCSQITIYSSNLNKAYSLPLFMLKYIFLIMRDIVVYYDRNEVIIVIIQKVTHFPPRLQTTSAGFKESYLEILNIFRHVWHMLRNLIYFLSPRDEDRIMLMFKGESKFILDVSTKQCRVTFYLDEIQENTRYLNPGVMLIKSILNHIE